MNRLRWPQKGDRAFAAGSHRAVQAYPGWLPVSFRHDAISEGFRASADHIVEMLATKGEQRYADIFFNPVAYLYRHFLEVAMKSLLREGMDLGMVGEENDAKLGHDLQRLWGKTRKLIEELWPDGDPEPVIAVERVVLEFHEIDRSGQELRYAVDTKGNPCLEKAPHQICLLNLRDVMSGLYNFFMGCDAQLAHLSDCKNEMRSSGYYGP